MTITVTPVANTQTFGAWLSTTNRLANLMSQNTVTSDSSNGGSITTGNSFVNGHFGAEFVYVANTLIGGNVSSNGVLRIQANLAVTNGTSNLFTITANSTVFNISATGNTVELIPTGNVIIGGNTLVVNTANVSFSSTVTLNGVTTFAANVNFDSNTLFIDSVNNSIGITGTAYIDSNSSSDAFRITQTGTGNALVIEDSTNPDSSPFVIDASGRILVGRTTTPFGSTSVAIEQSIADTAPPTIDFSKNRAAAIVNSGDGIGRIRFWGYDGTALKNAADITAVVDGTPGANDMPGRLVFSTTADGNNTPIERMRITSNGNIGIGVATPIYRLDVAQGSNTAAVIRINQSEASATSTARAGVYLDKAGINQFALSVDGAVAANGTTYYEARSATGQHIFFTNSTEKFRISANGNVGIGNSTPTHKLSVDGTSYFSANSNFIGHLNVGNATHNVAISQTSIIISNNITITANGSNGTSGQVLSSNGTGLYWSTPTSVVNTAAQYSWTNTHSFAANVTFNDIVTLSNINNGPLAGFRNAVMNGNFDIWQRATSFSNPASGAYTADRWLVPYDGSGATRTISRQAFTLGQTDVPGEPTYFYRYNQSVAGSGGTSSYIGHRIEGVRTYAGRQVTLSFYAKAAASLTMPFVLLRQYFGTGGSPSSLVDTTLVTNQAITTSWSKYTYTATLPSISGKTIGSDNNDYLEILLLLPVNTTFTFDLSQVQLEPGPVATQFERRPYGTELRLCQRYYCETRASARFPAFGAGQIVENHILWPVEMRKEPTVTITSGGIRSNVLSGYPQTNPPITKYGARYLLASNGSGDSYALNETVTAAAEL